MKESVNILINKVIGYKLKAEKDFLAVEEPLEIRISFIENGIQTEKNISVTMRTPGNDDALALGFLFTEGIITADSQVSGITMTGENRILIKLNDDVAVQMNKLERNFYTTSSCGVCGKSSIDAITTSRSINETLSEIQIKATLLYSMTSELRKKQNVFEQTGGLHASALFNIDGDLILLNEDVGRHNALDKIIGTALLKKLLPLDNYVLLLSGRSSFELVQKAYMAGISIIAAVGAPSSLAVEFTKEKKMTLIGFMKNEKFNIYSGPERILQLSE